MFLNVILTILVIMLIGMVTILIIWWKKYGKKLFESVGDIKTMFPKGSKHTPTMGNLTNAFGELKKSMEMLNNLKNGGNKNGK
jgi:hypothetical protein